MKRSPRQRRAFTLELHFFSIGKNSNQMAIGKEALKNTNTNEQISIQCELDESRSHLYFPALSTIIHQKKRIVTIKQGPIENEQRKDIAATLK